MTDMKKPMIAFSTGGTGGHVWPAVALHEALQELGYETIFFTDDRGYRWLPKDEDILVRIIKSSAIPSDLAGRLSSAMTNAGGLLKSIAELFHYKPKVIIGFGGYSSFPAIVAARFLRIPIILHEQNSIFGRANRVAAPWAKKIALSFRHTHKLSKSYADKCVLTGNPPLKKILDVADKPYPERKPEDPFRIVVVGGSQGAKIFGEVIHKAVEKLPEDERKKIHIVQQCIKEDIPLVKTAYETMGIEARVEPFIKDYVDQTSLAHLIISRAGAGSISLNNNIGRPAIYVPLAISLEGDQSENAQYVVKNDAGWIINEADFSPDLLSNKLAELIKEPEILKKTADNAKKLGHLDATHKLTELIRSLIE